MRPEVGGVPSYRADGPGCERQEGARGEDACQLKGQRYIPEHWNSSGPKLGRWCFMKPTP